MHQKILIYIRSLPGAHAFCRIRGYLLIQRKGSALLNALEQVLLGHPVLADCIFPEEFLRCLYKV